MATHLKSLAKKAKLDEGHALQGEGGYPYI